MLQVAAPADPAVQNSSFLSATPSPLVSVYLKTSSASVSIDRTLSPSQGRTKRGKTSLSTKTVWRS